MCADWFHEPLPLAGGRKRHRFRHRQYLCRPVLLAPLPCSAHVQGPSESSPIFVGGWVIELPGSGSARNWEPKRILYRHGGGIRAPRPFHRPVARHSFVHTLSPLSGNLAWRNRPRGCVILSPRVIHTVVLSYHACCNVPKYLSPGRSHCAVYPIVATAPAPPASAGRRTEGRGSVVLKKINDRFSFFTFST